MTQSATIPIERDASPAARLAPLRGASALPNDASPFALGGASPDALLLARCKGMLETCDADITLPANHLGG